MATGSIHKASLALVALAPILTGCGVDTIRVADYDYNEKVSKHSILSKNKALVLFRPSYFEDHNPERWAQSYNQPSPEAAEKEAIRICEESHKGESGDCFVVALNDTVKPFTEMHWRMSQTPSWYLGTTGKFVGAFGGAALSAAPSAIASASPSAPYAASPHYSQSPSYSAPSRPDTQQKKGYPITQYSSCITITDPPRGSSYSSILNNHCGKKLNVWFSGPKMGVGSDEIAAGGSQGTGWVAERIVAVCVYPDLQNGSICH